MKNNLIIKKIFTIVFIFLGFIIIIDSILIRLFVYKIDLDLWYIMYIIWGVLLLTLIILLMIKKIRKNISKNVIIFSIILYFIGFIIISSTLSGLFALIYWSIFGFV